MMTVTAVRAGSIHDWAMPNAEIEGVTDAHPQHWKVQQTVADPRSAAAAAAVACRLGMLTLAVAVTAGGVDCQFAGS